MEDRRSTRPRTGGRSPGGPRPDYRRSQAEPLPLPEAPEGAPRLILGQNPVREAIRAHKRRVHEVLIESPANPRVEALERFARDQDLQVRSVSRAELDRLSQGGRHQGVAAWAEPLQLVRPEELLGDPQLMAIALDGVVDPQNFGAVVRSAVGVAGAAVVFPENAAAPLTPTTFRASAGAVEHARLCRVKSLPAFLLEAQARGVRIVGLAPEAVTSLDEIDFSGPTILVIGSEEDGMARATRRACTDLAKLMSSNLVQSLNASVAAGIALYAAAVGRKRTS
jgi:23S rRNA (guanosine2251-2'-O)-methyltransferase